MMRGLRSGMGAIVGLLGVLLAALGACSDPVRGGDARVDGGSSDASAVGGSGDARADADHDLTTVKIRGKLRINYTPAVGVQITARCGNKVGEARSDDAGEYSVVADVAGCAPLVVEFRKEFLVPSFRVIALPPPASPLHLDLELAEAGKLQCNAKVCTVDGYAAADRELSSCDGRIKQGFTYAQTGPAGLPYVPGEYRQQDGSLLRILGFSHYLFRDVDNKEIGAGPCAQTICTPVDSQVLDWFGDAEGRLISADPTHLLNLIFDPTSGRWSSQGPTATVAFTCTYDLQGKPRLEPLPANALDDVRTGRFFVNGGENGDCKQADAGTPEATKVAEYWVCSPTDGSGWYGAGLPVPRKGCLNITATKACGTPAATTAVSVAGMDNGFRAEGWTDRAGRVCFDVTPSEPINPAEDLDFDGLKGEVVQLRVSSVREGTSTTQVEYVDSPRARSATEVVGCREPATCQQLVIKDASELCSE